MLARSPTNKTYHGLQSKIPKFSFIKNLGEKCQFTQKSGKFSNVLLNIILKLKSKLCVKKQEYDTCPPPKKELKQQGPLKIKVTSNNLSCIKEPSIVSRLKKTDVFLTLLLPISLHVVKS